MSHRTSNQRCSDATVIRDLKDCSEATGWPVFDLAVATIERLTRERDEWSAKWHRVRAELAELKYPGMKGVVRPLSGEPTSAHETAGEPAPTAVRFTFDAGRMEPVLEWTRMPSGDYVVLAGTADNFDSLWFDCDGHHPKSELIFAELIPQPTPEATERMLAAARLAQHESTEKAPETKHEHGAAHGTEQAVEVASKAGNSAEWSAPVAVKTVEPDGPAIQSATNLDEGKLWSFLRDVMTTGCAIETDTRALGRRYEEHSARLDAAARDAVPQFFKRLGFPEKASERKLTDAENEAMDRDIMRAIRGSEKAKCEHGQEIGSYCGECPSDIAE